MLTLHQTIFQALPPLRLICNPSELNSEVHSCTPVISIAWCKVFTKLSLSHYFSRLDILTSVLSLGSEVKLHEHSQQPMDEHCALPPAPNRKQQTARASVVYGCYGAES